MSRQSTDRAASQVAGRSNSAANSPAPLGGTPRRGTELSHLVDDVAQMSEILAKQEGLMTGQMDSRRGLLLQQYIQTITNILHKLSADIQVLQMEMKQRDVATARLVHNVQMSQTAGVDDLRGRVVRCDAAIATLSRDFGKALERLDGYRRQHDEQTETLNSRLHRLEHQLEELSSSIRLETSRHSMQLHRVESVAEQQVNMLSTKTQSIEGQLKSAVQQTTAVETAERDKLDARLTTQMNSLASQTNNKLEAMDRRHDDMFHQISRTLTQLQQQVQRDNTATLKHKTESETVRRLNERLASWDSEMERVKVEYRTGLETLRESMLEMSGLVESRCQLLEQQLRRHVNARCRDVKQNTASPRQPNSVW